jgi:hypothetical protein
VDRPLPIRDVLRETWTLYRRLLGRTVLVGALVLGTSNLLLFLLLPRTQSTVGALLAVLAAAMPLVATGLVQGTLAEAVDDVHAGRVRASPRQLLRAGWARFRAVTGVSLLVGVGVAVGLVALVVPGLVLLTRWSLAIPAAVLERLPARAAMRRSRELVRGHGWSVFRVLLNVLVAQWAFSTAVRLLAVRAVGGVHPHLALWGGRALAAAVALPFTAHALTVVYYRLAEPEQPVIPAEERLTWESVWREHDRGRAA